MAAVPADAGADHRHRPGRAAGRRLPGRRRRRGRRRAAHPAQLRLHRRQARRRRRQGARPASTAPRSTCAALVATVSATLLETLVEPSEDRLVIGGTANLARGNALDFPGTVRPLLEALEEQVVVLRLMAQVDASTVLVRIGEENAHEALTGASFVSVGYGSGRPRPRRPRHRRPHPHGLPRKHGRGSRRGPLRRPPAGRELRLRHLDGNRLLRRAGRGPRCQRHRDQARLPQDGPRPAPRRQPRAGAKERFQEVTRAYEALTDPEKRRIVDLGGDPFDTGGGGGAGGFGGAGFGGLGDIMDAFFGGAATRGPRSRTRAGRDALIPIELELDETVFGVTKDITVDTAVLCTVCTGAGTAPGTHPTTCTTCSGRGEVQSVQRGFLGQVVVQPGLPDLRRHRPGHPRAVPRVRRRRPGPPAPHHLGQGAGRRRGRHADPADRPGRGRPRRRPGR